MQGGVREFRVEATYADNGFRTLSPAALNVCRSDYGVSIPYVRRFHAILLISLPSLQSVRRHLLYRGVDSRHQRMQFTTLILARWIANVTATLSGLI